VHELRLFQMLVRRDGTVVTDYDFRLGKNYLRGTGWRGLIALVIILIFLAAMAWILITPVKPAGSWLFQLVVRHLGVR
jgi:hypothetical protein